MDGFFTIFKKAVSELICTRLYLQTTKHHFLPSGFFHTVLPAADHNGVKSLFEVAMKLGYLTIGKVIEI